MTFVGREWELDLLERELALALELPAGRSIFISGPPGTGKTALVTEFLERVGRSRPDVAIARGRCLQTFGSADPYMPFVDALRDLTDESTAGAVKKETLSELFAEIAPYWLSVIPMVGNLLSAGFATAARIRGGGPPSAAPSREALFIQYLEVVQRLAQQGPLILLLDDLHWADQSSIALLAHVSRGISSFPVVLLGTLRGDEAELEKHPISNLIRELEREGTARAIQLGELGAQELGALLTAEFGGDISDPLERWIGETAGGNPLFASELARLLRQSGAAVEVLGEWQLTAGVAQLEVPRSAEAVIETRIQRLDAEEVRLLQYASVEGNEFDSVVVAMLFEQDELEVLDTLERLERRYQLIRSVGEKNLPNGDIATLFRFHHALVQTVLYRQVLGKRRILLHRKAGEILESLFGEEVDGIAGTLARHYNEGRMSEPAYRYARKAADGARRAYAHWEAEELYRVALQNAPAEPERGEVQERLGDVYYTVGYHEQAIGAYWEALSLQVQHPAQIRIRRKTAVVERKAGLVPAPTLLQRLRSLITEAQDHDEEQCRLLLEILYLPHAVGLLDTAEEAVRLADRVGDRGLLAQALEQLAVVHILSGAPERALPLLERAFELGGRDEDPMRAARYHDIRGVAHAKLGQYRQAVHSFEQKLRLSERMNNPHFISGACNNIGAALLILGGYERAEAMLQRAKVINERRYRVGLIHCLLNLAKRAHWSGELEVAVERYGELLECAVELQYWTSEAVAHAGLGLCHLEMNRVPEARQAAESAIAIIADREEWFEDRDFVEILLAHLEAIEGAPLAGAARLEKVAANLEAADLFVWTQVLIERVRILAEVDPAEARRVLARVTNETRGIELSLDGEIERLRVKLEGHSALAPRTG